MSQPAIAVEGLSKRFGKRAAVDGLSFEVPTGGVCGFLGRNGAGKTTAIRMLMNLTEPSAGQALLLGLDARRHHTELMARVGYVAEVPMLYDWMTVRELARFTSQFYAKWNTAAVEAMLGRFGIDQRQKVRHLSRGTHAQLALALALGHDPELLILDEPATGLDVLVRRDFLESIIQIIQQEGRTVLFSSHLVHEVERVADQIVVIEAGRLLVSSSLDELKQQAGQSLEDIFVGLVGAGRAAEVRQ
jgi:ABC-2 type transport system ATP-binding protein